MLHVFVAVLVTAVVVRALHSRRYRLAVRDLVRALDVADLRLQRARRLEVVNDAKNKTFDLTIGIQVNGSTLTPTLYRSYGRSWTSLSRKDRRRIVYATIQDRLASEDCVGPNGIWLNDEQRQRSEQTSSPGL